MMICKKCGRIFDEEDARYDDEGFASCPHCYSAVIENAVLCPICGEYVPESEAIGNVCDECMKNVGKSYPTVKKVSENFLKECVEINPLLRYFFDDLEIESILFHLIEERGIDTSKACHDFVEDNYGEIADILENEGR